MAIARDESLSPPRFPDARRKRTGYQAPEVLFETNFKDGFGGFRDHVHGAGNDAPLSLTSWRTDDNSPNALMLSVGARPSTDAIRSGRCSTYKNLQRDIDSGLMEIQVWMALGGADLDNSPNDFMIGLDSQNWYDEWRTFGRLMCRRFSGPDVNGHRERADVWTITDDKANAVIIPDQGEGAPPYPGDNENKGNIFMTSLTMDFDHVNADGSRGRYHSALIGGRRYDLTGLGAGRGKQNPQINSSVGAGSFAGGLNIGIGLGNRTVYRAAGPSWLAVTKVRLLNHQKV